MSQFSDFAGSIRGDRDYPVTFDRALEVQAIIEALYESNRSRAWVDIAVPPLAVAHEKAKLGVGGRQWVRSRIAERGARGNTCRSLWR